MTGTPPRDVFFGSGRGLGTGGRTVTQLASGKQVASEVVLYAAGRQGETDDLELERAGLEADERGRIAVGPDYRTAVEHIFAAGDVVGWPALAATSMEQGRVAARTRLRRGSFDV